MSRKNPTSARRKGDYYQELWGVKLCGDWINNPKLYQWIHFEKIPDEIDQHDFYLDDIVALKENGRYDLYQTKHKQNIGDLWTWDELIKPLSGKKKSLLTKWADSLFREKDGLGHEFYNKTEAAFFITNNEADNEIKKYLRNDSIDMQKIQREDAELYKSIQKAIGDNSLTANFFSKFRFCFNQKSEDELEKGVRKFFNTTLYVTKSGFDSLLKWVRERAQEQQTKPLKLEEIKRECEFDNPQPLNESFEIPSDFEFFDNKKHQDILDEFKKSEGGIKVIFGKPGVGKSVYLSKLDEALKRAEIISIKHHYHISPEDPNPQERLNSERVVEAIKAQFKTHREDIGDLANKNSKEIALGEFVKAVAVNSNKKKKAFVIILDGLDHVLRYGHEEELKTFLREICFPQVGVWIVIGMQPIAKSYLPQIVFDKCPEKEWIEIKGLNKISVFNLVKANKISLNLPNQVGLLNQFLERLYEITSGNPLHLRYTLKQLKNRLGSSLATEYECSNLIPYSDDIEKYYESLWSQIPDNAKTFLLTIASVNFLFTHQQLIECVSFFVKNPKDITNSFNAISHLISENRRKQISVYHNSFERFLKNRKEAEQQKITIKTNVKKWLGQSNYEYLKWAELKIIEYDLGNKDPILKINRKWLVDAIYYPANANQISSQMKLAARVAFVNGDFAKALQISYLYTYYLNSKDFVEEASELIWQETLQQNNNVLDYIDFQLLPTATLAILAKIANSKGDSIAIKEIIEILIERLDRQEYQKNSVPSVTSAILEVLPYDRTHGVNKIHKYIIQFRDLNISSALFKIYSRSLLRFDQKEKIKALLRLNLSAEEEKEILGQCVLYGFEHNTDNISEFFNKSKNLPILSSLYCYLKSGIVTDLPSLPQYDIFPQTIREHDFEERSKWKEFYYSQFLTALLYGIFGKKDDIEQWIKQASDLWSIEAMKRLFIAALQISDGIKQTKISYNNLFVPLSGLKELKWPEDRDVLGLQHAFSDALALIMRDMISFNKYFGNDFQINLKDYTAITKIPILFNKHDLINLILDLEEPLFTKDVYEKIRDENISNLSQTINYFPERAKDYANFSKLARIYGDHKNSQSLLKKAIDNLLGYGYHKDICLFHVIEAVEFCIQAGIDKEKIDGWIKRIVPLVDAVGDYTDGDETNHLPFELANILAKQNPKLLYKNYYDSADKEEFYHAEDLFRYLIKSLPYINDEQIILASTALDKDSFSELKNIAQSNIGAKRALDIIQNYLGEINYPKEKDSSITDIKKPHHDYSRVKSAELLDHLSTNFENRWDRDNYLLEWTKYWLNNDKKEDIYKVLKSAIEKSGIQSISGELLDVLYPLAHEFDNGKVFDFLCYAQINDHGWNRYWTDKKKAEKRWKFVKEKYPQRYLEFFQKSTDYHVPLPLGVEYLLLFDDLENAEAITEASVQFAESLMADLSLSPPKWIKNINEINEIDILLQRLLWPSPLIRERAANGIAYLLIEGDKKKNIYAKLLAWIKEQKMESTVAIGLLPIIRAFYISRGKNLNYINLSTIVDSIQVNSIVIEKLIQELVSLMNVKKIKTPDYKSIDLCPVSYSVNVFFSKHIKTFLAPIYFIRATKIERSTGKSFIKQWSFTADEIIKDNGIIVNTNQVYYYARSEHDEFLAGFSPKISEVYRSSFLRVLYNFYKNGDIEEDFYLEYAYATLPIELSKWKVAPNRIPDWWPRLIRPAGDQKKEESIIPVAFQTPIESLIKKKKENQLIAAEGAVQPANSWRLSNPDCSFSLIGFGYKIIGAQMPTPEEVAEEISYAPNLVRIPSNTDRPFHFLEDQKNFLTIKDEHIRVKDMLVYPFVMRERDFCIALWQYFRDFDVSLNLNLSLSQNLKLIINKNSWIYQDKKGIHIASYADWLEGLKQRYDRDMPIPHGQYLMVNYDFLDQWLQDKKLRMGYIVKTTYSAKKYSYDETKKFEDVKFLNVSNIII